MINLYTTNCPRCKVLESKLKQTGREFNIINDVEKIIEKGFTHAPILEVDGKFMDYSEAFAWING